MPPEQCSGGRMLFALCEESQNHVRHLWNFQSFGGSQSRLSWSHALQHRGQESAGIVSSDGASTLRLSADGARFRDFHPRHFEEASWKKRHRPRPVFNCRLERYSKRSALCRGLCSGSMSVAHNGNLINASLIRSQLESEGSIFQSTSDTEVIIHLIARSKAKTFIERTIHALTTSRRFVFVGLPHRQRAGGCKRP